MNLEMVSGPRLLRSKTIIFPVDRLRQLVSFHPFSRWNVFRHKAKYYTYKKGELKTLYVHSVLNFDFLNMADLKKKGVGARNEEKPQSVHSTELLNLECQINFK